MLQSQVAVTDDHEGKWVCISLGTWPRLFEAYPALAGLCIQSATGTSVGEEAVSVEDTAVVLAPTWQNVRPTPSWSHLLQGAIVVSITSSTVSWIQTP